MESKEPTTQETATTKPEEETKADTGAGTGEAPSSGLTYGDEEEEEAKQIKLQGEKVKSADDDETLIYIHKAKLYRIRDGAWKERGNGYCKLMRSKDNKIRFLLRAEKTLKVSANFLSKPTLTI
jgi:E3 SUMO-protein ligase RanBP2